MRITRTIVEMQRQSYDEGGGSHVAIGFFFQAEDGIRDGRVTGVQTCALPISALAEVGMVTSAAWIDYDHDGKLDLIVVGRSEERRVGKECIPRWKTYH